MRREMYRFILLRIKAFYILNVYIECGNTEIDSFQRNDYISFETYGIRSLNLLCSRHMYHTIFKLQMLSLTEKSLSLKT